MSLQALESVLQVLIAGAMIGCIYGLMCIGLGMIFGVMRIINFAQGEFLMLGMYAAAYTSIFLGRDLLGPWTPFIAILIACPLLFLFGALIYRVSLAGVSEDRDLSEDTRHSAQLIVTLGLALVIQNCALIVFGSTPLSASTSFSTSAWIVGPLFGDDVMLFINRSRGIAAIYALVAVVLVFVVVNRTKLGKSVRAAADNADAARYCGINVRWIYLVTFGIGTAVTALAGGLSATNYPFQPYVGAEFVVIMYAGVVLGGMGSIAGAFWGGLTIGMLQQVSTLVLPQQLQNFTIFAVFILVLLIRPEGLFGRTSERP